MQIHIYFYCPSHNCPIGHAELGANSWQSHLHLVAPATSARTHLFHPRPLHIEVLIPSFQITILMNRTAVSPNHVEALQMTLSCGLNPPDTNQEHNGHTSHHHVHVQSFLQCEPNGLVFDYNTKKFTWCTCMAPNTNLKAQNCV